MAHVRLNLNLNLGEVAWLVLILLPLSLSLSLSLSLCLSGVSHINLHIVCHRSGMHRGARFTLSMVDSVTALRLPAARRHALVNALFLRFLCSAIAIPTKYRLTFSA